MTKMAARFAARRAKKKLRQQPSDSARKIAAKIKRQKGFNGSEIFKKQLTKEETK